MKAERSTDRGVKAVLFDMDGTLIDTEKYYRICWKEALAEFGYHMSDEQALAMRSLGRPFAPARLRAWFGEELDYLAVRSRRKEIMEEYLKQEGVCCKPGAAEILTFLKEQNLIIALATATDLERTRCMLGQLELLSYFDKLISATMVREGKPSPDIYRYACASLNLPPGQCLAVEDSPNGVLSAVRAGCPTVMIPDQTRPDTALRPRLYACLDSLTQLKDFV